MKLRNEESSSDYESTGSATSNPLGKQTFTGINVTGPVRSQLQNTNSNQGSRNQYSNYSINRNQVSQPSYRRHSNNHH